MHRFRKGQPRAKHPKPKKTRKSRGGRVRHTSKRSSKRNSKRSSRRSSKRSSRRNSKRVSKARSKARTSKNRSSKRSYRDPGYSSAKLPSGSRHETTLIYKGVTKNGNTSDKFWYGNYANGEIFTKYGRVGSTPRFHTKKGTYGEFEALVKSKMKKGYQKTKLA